MQTLNERAFELCNAMVADANALGIAVSTLDCGTRIIDCGVNAPGSEKAGLRLASVCMSGLGLIDINAADEDAPATQQVYVSTRSPVVACMASQYAGWAIKGEKFFAMGSGPMRAAAGREELFDSIGYREKPDVCVGILETGELPPDRVCIDIATKCDIRPDRLTLLAARTSSQAGTIQIVARSVETALHKLHVLGFELEGVERAAGLAPLPPLAMNDFAALGWANDAILYGGGVVLEVGGDDTSIEKFGPQVPSSASPDYGRPFAEIFARYDHDFYRIDPHLFSPAVVILNNCETGSTFKYGNLNYDVLAESFAKK